ncbi:MAG: hypothetical protein Q8912_16020 [Bacillota bacterium]|nr:hypothetical protein [Bacillota bacterium]
MFCHHQRNYHTHGFLFILSLIAAFMLGRKSEQYGYTIISRGYSCHDDDDDLDMMVDPTPSDNNYPQ